MKIMIAPKFNFHIARPISARPQFEGRNINQEEAYFFSSRQAARIARHFCGITDCRCNGGQLIQEDEQGTLWSIKKTDCR